MYMKFLLVSMSLGLGSLFATTSSAEASTPLLEFECQAVIGQYMRAKDGGADTFAQTKPFTLTEMDSKKGGKTLTEKDFTEFLYEKRNSFKGTDLENGFSVNIDLTGDPSSNVRLDSMLSIKFPGSRNGTLDLIAQEHRSWLPQELSNYLALMLPNSAVNGKAIQFTLDCKNTLQAK